MTIPSELSASHPPLLSIGYGTNRTADQFVSLLREFNVQYVADVRTKPFSKFRPEFSKDSLQIMLKRSGFIYVFMGDSLGGLPDDPDCYTDGKVDYLKVQEQAWFNKGLRRLESGWKSGHRIVIMCAELEPDRCHRSKLIGQALTNRSIPIMHIDERGTAISQTEAMKRLTNGQGTLFDVGHTSRRKYRNVPAEKSR